MAMAMVCRPPKSVTVVHFSMPVAAQAVHLRATVTVYTHIYILTRNIIVTATRIDSSVVR